MISRFVADPSIVRVIDTAVDLKNYVLPTPEERTTARLNFGLDNHPVAVYWSN